MISAEKFLSHLLVAPLLLCLFALSTQAETRKYTRTPIMFIASLGDPNQNSGTGAQTWGIWNDDPAQRALRLKYYPLIRQMGGFTPANWQIQEDDWWLDENGLIMQPPEFPLPAGNYLVTGDREVTTSLIIHPADANGEQRWELGDDAQLFDVTHLPCRSARYTPLGETGTCLPSQMNQEIFPLPIGTQLPNLTNCDRQIFSVLLVIGKLEK